MFFIVSFEVTQIPPQTKKKVIIDTISGEKHKKSMLAEFVIKKVEHEKENSNSKPLPGKRNVKICKKVVRLTIMLI